VIASFLPWWSVLLLSMWAVALTVWIHPSLNRELRLWAGSFTLFYTLLILIAFGGVQRANEQTDFWPKSLFDVALAACMSISLTATIWSLGPISYRCRRSCAVIYTTSNGGICAILKLPEVALGLVLIAGLTAWPLVQQWLRYRSPSLRDRLTEFFQFADTPTPENRRGEIWLLGGLLALLGFTLMGPIHDSFQSTLTPAFASPIGRPVPSTEQIDQLLKNSTLRGTSSIDLLGGVRSDIVVLLSIILFLLLAASMTSPKRVDATPGEKL
jgi:hypothetical protein